MRSLARGQQHARRAVPARAEGHLANALSLRHVRGNESSDGEGRSYEGHAAGPRWEERRHGEGSDWCEASIEDVRTNLATTGYPEERLRFIKGKVEDTIPGVLPDRISVLRLDTDWYESTRHELEHLYPRQELGGVLIIDDYGHWQGARIATDEYFAAHDIPLLLHRIDYTGRIAIKPGPNRVA